MTSIGATSRHTDSRPAARTIVRLRGALDVAAAPALRERLIDMLHPGTSLLVLDLSRVPSCDPAGASRADRHATPRPTAWHRHTHGRSQPAGCEAAAPYRPGPQPDHLSRSPQRARRATARARKGLSIPASSGRREGRALSFSAPTSSCCAAVPSCPWTSVPKPGNIKALLRTRQLRFPRISRGQCRTGVFRLGRRSKRRSDLEKGKSRRSYPDAIRRAGPATRASNFVPP